MVSYSSLDYSPLHVYGVRANMTSLGSGGNNCVDCFPLVLFGVRRKSCGSWNTGVAPGGRLFDVGKEIADKTICGVCEVGYWPDGYCPPSAFNSLQHTSTDDVRYMVFSSSNRKGCKPSLHGSVLVPILWEKSCSCILNSGALWRSNDHGVP